MSGHVVKVLIVDDHEIVRLGIRGLLSSTQRYQIVGEASDAAAAIEAATCTNPDLVILDHTLPGCDPMALASVLKGQDPKLRILLHCSGNMISEVAKAIDVGIAGLVLKSQKEKYLLEALEAVSDGRRYYLPSSGQAEADTEPGAPLSSREREVVQLLAEGTDYMRIAKILGVKKKTVECFRNSAMQKLRMGHGTELVRYAVKAGLVCA